MIRGAIARTVERLAQSVDPNPWTGDDPDLYRTWAAVDATTSNTAFFSNLYEVRECLFARYRHAAVEGAEYRGERP